MGVVEEMSLSVISHLLFSWTLVSHLPLCLAQLSFPTHIANLPDAEGPVDTWDPVALQTGPHCLCRSQQLLYLGAVWLNQSGNS